MIIPFLDATSGLVELVPVPTDVLDAVIAFDLPYSPSLYFNDNVGLRHFPVTQLVATRARWSGVKNAALLMSEAAKGKISKREPITTSLFKDYSRRIVLDGNSTFIVASVFEWRDIPVVE